MEYSELERTHRDHRAQAFRNGPHRDQGPVARGQLSRQLSRHCSLPGSSWLSLPVPEPLEPEQSPKKPMSSSEPILDLKGDTAEALPENPAGAGEQSPCPPRDPPGHGQSMEHPEPTPAAPEDAAEPKESPGTRQDPADSGGWERCRNPRPCRALPGSTHGRARPGQRRSVRGEGSQPRQLPAVARSSRGIPSPPQHPGLLQIPEKDGGGEAGGAAAGAVTTQRSRENGVEVTPATTTATSEERRALQSELGKCIEEFRRIKIPVAFPNKKRQWQSELLKKYQL
ncbi:basic salivary proline-rich protein 1-like [Corvus cornix cornix]|uniref:basic salivary proline-rich protein 1-like n=1 Tax=Corvus cornix cornix TaxID=932674 RepID=UPI00194EC97A|nr:basic salivary proline-rich protein 1-like [Corvus cornix cornix]